MAHLNLDSKTLIYNWVEERQCHKFDRDSRDSDGLMKKEVFVGGHKGLLTIDSTRTLPPLSTTHDSFSPKPLPMDCSTGDREVMLRQQLSEAVAMQLEKEEQELNKQPPWASTTRTDFTTDVDGVGLRRLDRLEQVHPLSESPASYWIQNPSQVTGMTTVAVDQSPFSKNASFTCPVEQRLD